MTTASLSLAAVPVQTRTQILPEVMMIRTMTMRTRMTDSTRMVRTKRKMQQH